MADKGRVKVEWHGEKVKKTLEDVMLEALWLTGQSALSEAVDDVPVETGTLLRSGTVTVGGLPHPESAYTMAEAGMTQPYSKEKFGGKKAVYVSYNTPYAAWLHETPNGTSIWRQISKKIRKEKTKRTVWHGHLKPNAQWKWLERALPRAWAKFARNLARAKRKMGVD